MISSQATANVCNTGCILKVVCLFISVQYGPKWFCCRYWWRAVFQTAVSILTSIDGNNNGQLCVLTVNWHFTTCTKFSWSFQLCFGSWSHAEDGHVQCIGVWYEGPWHWDCKECCPWRCEVSHHTWSGGCCYIRSLIPGEVFNKLSALEKESFNGKSMFRDVHSKSNLSA